MKTPIQELIETFEEMRSPVDSKVDVDFAISLIKSMLEKEKEVMGLTWNDGHQAGRLEGKGVAEEGFQIFDDYYNETFNTKEK